MWKKWIAACAGVGASWILVGTASAAPVSAKVPVKIAFIDPLSGSFSNLGHQELALFEFEARTLNKKGGLDGHPIKIVPFDNKLSPQQTVVQFHNAANQGIRYVLQANGDDSASALLNAVNQHDVRDPKDPVLYLNYGAIGPQFTNSRCSFWQFMFDDNTKMKMNILTDWIKKQKSIKKVYLLNQDYGFGHDVARYAIKMLKQKRPDIKVVGDVFVPLGQVKDFTPYVVRIKASGANAIITGNWGPDLTLFFKAATASGLKIPFLTYYASLAGTPTEIGNAAVNHVYMVSIGNGDYANPALASQQVVFKRESGFDIVFVQEIYALGMLKQAADTAHSIDPGKVALALEGLRFDGPYGASIMRAKDHQLLAPTFISVFTNHMKYGIEHTNHLNFHAIDKFDAQQTALATSCVMHNRPGSKRS